MSDIVMALARANLYGFLSTVFSAPPTAEWLAAARDRALLEILGELGWTFAVDRAVHCEETVLAQEELAVAFTRLMIGPGKGYVPPYGSIYLDRAGGASPLSSGGGDGSRRGDRPQLWGPSTIAVEQLYRAAGLELVQGQIADHVGVELAFMRYLCACEAHAAAEHDAMAAERWHRWQIVVLHDHLGRWVPAWAATVERAATHPFYVAMVRLAVEFLAWDAEALSRPSLRGVTSCVL
jgi:TorA maturation chaperone TorD